MRTNQLGRMVVAVAVAVAGVVVVAVPGGRKANTVIIMYPLSYCSLTSPVPGRRNDDDGDLSRPD
jgi:hypothetical protein